MNTTPRFSSSPAVLTVYDCWRLLETEEVARIAWVSADTSPDISADKVSIVPVNYTVADGSLWFRTQPYTALAQQCTGRRVAVEVDHLDRDTRRAWSVVITGVAERVPAEDVPDAVGQMTVWAPGRRSLFIRLAPVQVTGRRLMGRPQSS